MVDRAFEAREGPDDRPRKQPREGGGHQHAGGGEQRQDQPQPVQHGVGALQRARDLQRHAGRDRLGQDADVGAVRVPVVDQPTPAAGGDHALAGVGADLHARPARLEQLRDGVAGIPGARVERKRFAIAVHYRQVDGSRVPEIEAVVDRTAAVHPELRKAGGKKVFEMRPAIPWDKGKALGFLLETLGLAGADVLPIYIGDDETDEDAFRAVGDRGLAFVVRGEDDERPTVAHYSLADTAEVSQQLLLPRR